MSLESGIYARFLDSINGIKLDLLCSKLEPTIVTGKGKDRLNNNGKTAPLRKVEDNTKEDSPYIIDLNHLKGHARVLSEGCIKFVRGYGWELLRKDGPTSAGVKKDKDKRLLFLVRDEQEGNQMGSAEDLTPAPRKIKQSTRYKDAEVQALENFLNREKSKSV